MQAALLGYFMTDAKIAPGMLHQCLKEAVDSSFNMLSVDTNTNTSDTVAIMANGLAGQVDLDEFRCALQTMAKELAKEVARVESSMMPLSYTMAILLYG